MPFSLFHKILYSLLVQTRQRKQWVFFPEDLRRENELARELRISNLLAKCLLNRSISDLKTARDYLQPELGQLVDPFAFRQMPRAVERIRQALERKERILIHGDYDVDGVSGTVLLYEFFRLLRADVLFHIPNRLRDGYSFGQGSLERIRREKVNLVLTIDNGITAAAAIAQLRDEGIDTIITDHHKPSETEPLPPAVAILNPNLPDSGYPHGSLCGVAVAFKLAWALAQSLSPTKRASPEMKEFLLDAMGFVAVGTITDIVPLMGENRVLSKFGLAALQQSKRPGVRALLRAANLEGNRLMAEDVAFRIGPRINAAGRLGAAEKAVELFCTDSEERAQLLAQELEFSNQERQRIQKKIFEEAAAQVRENWDFKKHPVIVLGESRWHAGVVGIVCSKLVEEFHAPAILIAFEGEQGRGSARSMRGFELHSAMSRCSHLLLKFGGHAQAAGLEIHVSKLAEFRDALGEVSREMLRNGVPPMGLSIDAEIPLMGVSKTLCDEIGRLGPHGAGNEMPIFSTKDAKIAGAPRRVGKFAEHLQFHVQQGGKILKAIAFGMGERQEELFAARSVRLAYTPKLDSWAGRGAVNLEVRDFVTES